MSYVYARLGTRTVGDQVCDGGESGETKTKNATDFIYECDIAVSNKTCKDGPGWRRNSLLPTKDLIIDSEVSNTDGLCCDIA